MRVVQPSASVRLIVDCAPGPGSRVEQRIALGRENVGAPAGAKSGRIRLW